MCGKEGKPSCTKGPNDCKLLWGRGDVRERILPTSVIKWGIFYLHRKITERATLLSYLIAMVTETYINVRNKKLWNFLNASLSSSLARSQHLSQWFSVAKALKKWLGTPHQPVGSWAETNVLGEAFPDKCVILPSPERLHICVYHPYSLNKRCYYNYPNTGRKSKPVYETKPYFQLDLNYITIAFPRKISFLLRLAWA